MNPAIREIPRKLLSYKCKEIVGWVVTRGKVVDTTEKRGDRKDEPARQSVVY